MPTLFLMILLFVWITPLSVLRLSYASQFIEVLNAWGAIDVLMLSILASVLEISTFAQFMVGDKCIYIDSILQQYTNDLDLKHYATCFSLETKIKDGFWFLLLSVFGFLFVGGFLKHFLHQFLSSMLHLTIENDMDINDYTAIVSNENKRGKKNLISTVPSHHEEEESIDSCYYGNLDFNTEATVNATQSSSILNKSSGVCSSDTSCCLIFFKKMHMICEV
mmetsp:Transcript_5357/g.7376  ORF Transcript_5357/g.7376 Transcript_5357/m.7376 type:complete len:221 (-) Transcript_5357:84-746(-)